MKGNKIFKVIILIGLLTVSGVIIYYYWMNDGLDAVKNVPVYIMIMALVYILLQIIKRYLYREYNWWDWLYYIGLASMMLPTLLASDSNISTMNFLTDFGVLSLLIPIFLDGKKTIQTK